MFGTMFLGRHIEVLDVQCPRYSSEDSLSIDLTVKTNFRKQEMTFTATPTDPEPYGRIMFAAALSGQFGEIQPYNKEEI